MAKPTSAKTSEDHEIPTPPEDGSQAVATPSPAEIAEAQVVAGTIATRNDAIFQTFVTWCDARANKTDEDMFAIQAQIIADIIQGESAEEILTEKSPLHARDILGRPLLLHGFEIHEGSFEDSNLGYYAALTVSRPDSDDTRVVTCGAIKVLAKLYKLDEFGDWPQLFWFTEKKTSRGFGVLDIVRPTV